MNPGSVPAHVVVMAADPRRFISTRVVEADLGSALSLSGAAVAGVYRVAGKDMAPLEALVFGVGQTSLSVVISFSRILATL